MPARAKNILFIMCDQLRWDYLSCYGHPTLATPNIDSLAARGVRFTRAYVQSPICGPSRMSFYTGRYMQSHGSNWNGIPLKVGELTMGDYLRPLGVATVLVGKTHMVADREGMERLGIDPKSIIGVRVVRMRLRPVRARRRPARARARTAAMKVDSRATTSTSTPRASGRQPVARLCQCGAGDGNKLASGWAMRHARKPARVKEEDSETPYMTRRAMDFIARPATSRGACISPTSSRTGPTSRRRPTTTCTAPPM